MRIKIIAANALIVAVVGLLSFVMMRAVLVSALTNRDVLSADAKHEVQGAAARLQLDGLRAERFLTGKAVEPSTTDALSKGTQSARADAAKSRCEELIAQMRGLQIFEGNIPTLVALVDAQGRIVGRNGSDVQRGEDLAASHPGLQQALQSGQAGSDIWSDRDRYLVSYVVIRDQGKIVGAFVLGRPLSDTLTRVGDATAGHGLAVVVATGDTMEVVARSASSAATIDDTIKRLAKDSVKTALSSGRSGVAIGDDSLVAVAALEGLGDGKRAVLASVMPPALIEGVASLPFPILLATAIGILLVVVAGWLLGSYITRPIAALEEGILAILNGQTDRRFDLAHGEFGGLAFRLDQLLNKLFGVDETDSEGRVSRPPSPANFSDAMAVDDKRLEGEGTIDPESVARLSREDGSEYYSRIYREYISAKKNLGEATDHITEEAFVSRLQNMERDAAAKYGRPVRYKVNARDREVVLLAIPLP